MVTWDKVGEWLFFSLVSGAAGFLVLLLTRIYGKMEDLVTLVAGIATRVEMHGQKLTDVDQRLREVERRPPPPAPTDCQSTVRRHR